MQQAGVSSYVWMSSNSARRVEKSCCSVLIWFRTTAGILISNTENSDSPRILILIQMTKTILVQLQLTNKPNMPFLNHSNLCNFLKRHKLTNSRARHNHHKRDRLLKQQHLSTNTKTHSSRIMIHPANAIKNTKKTNRNKIN